MTTPEAPPMPPSPCAPPPRPGPAAPTDAASAAERGAAELVAMARRAIAQGRVPPNNVGSPPPEPPRPSPA